MTDDRIVLTVYNMTEGLLEIQGVTDEAGSHVTLQPKGCEGDSRQVPRKFLHNDNLTTLAEKGWLSLTSTDKAWRQIQGITDKYEDLLFLYSIHEDAEKMAKATNRSLEYCKIMKYRNLPPEKAQKLIQIIFDNPNARIRVFPGINEHPSSDGPNVEVGTYRSEASTETETATTTQTLSEQTEENTSVSTEDSSDPDPESAPTTSRRRRRTS